jgi:hypothetical protein
MTTSEFIDIAGPLNLMSVAVTGASGRAGDTIRHLVRFGFPGRLCVVAVDAMLSIEA